MLRRSHLTIRGHWTRNTIISQFLETVPDLTVGFEGPVSHAVAIVMHRTPVPPFPAVRIDHHLGVANGIHESKIRTDVIAHVTPSVVRTVTT